MKGDEDYIVRPSVFGEFSQDLSVLSSRVNALVNKPAEKVFPTGKLNDRDYARLQVALDCSGCAVWGKPLERGSPPSTNHELFAILLYRINVLAQICKEYGSLDKLTATHRTNFEHQLHLIRVIAIFYV